MAFSRRLCFFHRAGAALVEGALLARGSVGAAQPPSSPETRDTTSRGTPRTSALGTISTPIHCGRRDRGLPRELYTARPSGAAPSISLVAQPKLLVDQRLAARVVMGAGGALHSFRQCRAAIRLVGRLPAPDAVSVPELCAPFRVRDSYARSAMGGVL
jgi:hypothetical protein